MSEKYLQLGKEILASDTSSSAISSLRELLFNIVYGKLAQPNAKLNDVFGLYLTIAHNINLRNLCLKKTGREATYICAKLSISLLRYTNHLRADLAFLEAGQHSKNAGMNNMAFVMWNRFLDLCEAIQEQDLSLLDNSDLLNTDIPTDVLLSSRAVEVIIF